MKEPVHIEKVSETALSKSIAVSVIGIILCMICLVGTTWAWHSLSVTSDENKTFGANFGFSVTVTDDIEPDKDGVYAFDGGEYTVTLGKTGTAKKGFCKVIATKTDEDSETITYYIVDFTEKDSISFAVTGSGTLKFISIWGTPVEEYGSIPDEGIVLTLNTEPVEAEYEQEEEEIEEPELEPEDETVEEETPSEEKAPQEEETPSEETPTEPVETPKEETPVEEKNPSEEPTQEPEE